MSCEDFPCCGHESGCCPDYNESGEQLNMRCTCGAAVPLESSSSICNKCLRMDLEDDGYDDDIDFADDDGDDDCFDDGFEIDDDSMCYDHGFYGDEC